MARPRTGRMKVLLFVSCVVLAGFAWVYRNQLIARYYVHGLVRATESEQEVWAERLARLDADAVAALVSCFRGEGTPGCARAEACLATSVKRWGAADPRTAALADRLASSFSRFTPAGQQSVLRLEHVLGQLVQGTSAPAAVVRSAAATLLQAAHAADAGVHGAALELAASRLGRAKTPDMVQACRELARACLRDESAGNRARALRLALLPGVDLRNEVVALLHDSEPEIRRVAMLEVGPLPDLVPKDDLLPWLHDPDTDVRQICEAALRGRGLSDLQIKLGRLVTDNRPAIRLQLVDQLRHNSDVEPGVWLRRLSHDRVPAVRAAVVRVSASETAVDLSDRLEQMAQGDPSPTVRQLARFYLSCRKSE